MGFIFTLTVVGDGPDRGMLEEMSARLGLEDQIKFTGYVPEASNLLSCHRAYLHVATIENLPFVMIEALSYGLPIFSSCTGGVSEVFSDGVEGRYLPLDDAVKSAKIIAEWLSNGKLVNAARSKSRERFLNYFDAEQISPKMKEFLVGDE